MLSFLKSAFWATIVPCLFMSVDCGWLSADVLSIDSLRELNQHVNQASLVVLDIDDTLICYPTALGSKPWFEEACQRAAVEEGGWDRFHHLTAVLADRLRVVPVEVEAPAIVSHIQQRGIPLIGCTTRDIEHPVVKQWVLKGLAQLSEAGFDLTRSTPIQANFSFDLIPGATFIDGVLFTGRGRKGEILLRFIELNELSPDHLILVDDRRSECEAVDQLMKQKGIRCTALWYRAIEERDRDYVSDVAAKELARLPPEGECMSIRLQQN